MLKKSIWSALFLCAFLALPAPADELTSDQVASAYAGCQTYVTLTAAQQVTVCQATPYTLAQCNWGCQHMLSMTLAEDQELNQEYNDSVNARAAEEAAAQASGNASQGPPNCGTDNDGNITCGYQGDSPSQELNCGTNTPGSSSWCTEPNGQNSNVSCYTNLDGSTSCN